MRILVTGGSGFTGSGLVKRLLQRGHQITIVDKKEGLFDKEFSDRGVKIHYGSITDRKLMEEAVEGNDVVFHVAAAFREINTSKRTYWNVNVEGTRIVAEASLKAGVKRFIYCSTEGVHGKVDNPPIGEDGPIKPKDYYQYTKYEGEKVVKGFMEKGLPSVIVRPTGIYGPGDPGRFLMLFRWIKKHGWFPMFGDGNVVFHPVYIENLNDGFELAMEKDEALGNTYLIADERYCTLNELVKEVGRAMDINVKIRYYPFWTLLIASYVCEWTCKPLKISPPLFKRRADWYWENRGFSIDKAKRELGYVPKIDLPTGLRMTARWYEENGYI
ncbi:MAG: NAD-dependent epimerase/dehydratase family protein [Synergistetes bacterium]|nr:NAD-dependent epimerase/dehydratase family protein [Synergistota bacterium]